MLRILIVEDDSQLATTLKYLVEDNPRYRVVAMADDADSAIAAAETHDPDIALLDLHLAHGSTGFSAAARLYDLGVPCLFVSGKAPSFPMPDLALGCLMKPYSERQLCKAIECVDRHLRELSVALGELGLELVEDAEQKALQAGKVAGTVIAIDFALLARPGTQLADIFDGRIVPYGEAKVGVMTHGLQYGTGCFGGLRGFWNAREEELFGLRRVVVARRERRGVDDHRAASARRLYGDRFRQEWYYWHRSRGGL